ncbi:MAG TPA: hypothetical protein VNO33_22855 [Kofleriaceae bacterium]|nr:hypothetical protein [Kofleriaceae bacterium]
MTMRTVFGSLEQFEKGGIQLIRDDPRNYAFSNVFEVASRARPWDKTAVARNMEYVLEAVRAEGRSPWYTAAHDEFALVMDGMVEVELRSLEPADRAAPGTRGSTLLAAEPKGARMGRIRARRGHLSLLPAGAAYQLHAPEPSVLIIQTLLGEHTLERWAEICITR